MQLTDAQSDPVHAAPVQPRLRDPRSESCEIDPDMSSHEMHCLEVWGGNTPTDAAFIMPGIDAWIYSKPYLAAGEEAENEEDQTGGDIHYLSSCATGRISRMLIADVAGHGKAVAKVTATLASLLRKHSNQVNMTRFIHGLNREFVAQSESGIFATAIAATYWAPTNQIILCNAGHPRPMWYRASRGTWEPVVGQPLSQSKSQRHSPHNVPLGITDVVSYKATSLTLEQDDLLLLYTDSLIEATKPTGEYNGQAGLVSMLNALDASSHATLIPTLLDELSGYRGGEPENDDVTAMLLKSTPYEEPSLIKGAAAAGCSMSKALIERLRHANKPFPMPEIGSGAEQKLHELGFDRPELLTLQDITD